MITIKPFDRPVTFAYELLAKLRLLTLSGQNEDGELEWIGTFSQWQVLPFEEKKIIAEKNVRV